MNLDTARTEVRQRGFDYLSDTRVSHFLNTAKTEIEDAYPWPWLEASTTGIAPLTIADLKQVLYVSDTTNRRELAGTTRRALIVDDPDLSQTGTPAYWALDGMSTLFTWPTSTTASLLVRYVKFTPVLSAAADTPLIPSQYHGLWIDRAVVEALRDSDNHPEANGLLSDVDRRVTGLIGTLANRNLQNSLFVQAR